MNIPPYEQVVITLRETWSHKKRLSYVFLFTVVIVLVVGVLLPKYYVSSAIILLEQDTVMKPLLKERAVFAGNKDWARDAEEKIFVKEVLLDVAQKVDWNSEGESAEGESAEDSVNYKKYVSQIKKNTRIVSTGKNTLEFSYKDTNPQRAFVVTQYLVEKFVLLIQQDNRHKSNEAFNFISDQVDTYHSNLKLSEERLRMFKTEKFEGTINAVSNRILALERQLEVARIQLSEAQFKTKSLRSQLVSEKSSDGNQANKRAIQLRIADLQERMDILRLSYHDSYPDIVSIKVQINELEKKIEDMDSGEFYIQEVGVLENTGSALFQQIRGEISTEASNIEAHKVRINKLEKLLSEQKSRSERIHENDAELSELTRDYNVNKDIYQDLLKRRENARLSMNIELEQKGTHFRIISPAFIPDKPSGLGVLQFWLLAPLAGIALPIGLMYAMVMLDQRIRYRYALSEFVDAPVLTSIPSTLNPAHALLKSKENYVVGLVLGTFIVIYFGFAMINIIGIF